MNITISAKTNTLVDCVSASNINAKKTYDLFQSVSKAVDTAHTKISETDLKLTKVNNSVSKNKEGIILTKKESEEVNEELKKLKDSIAKITIERIKGVRHSTPTLMTRSWNLSIELVVINQARFNTAV